MLRRPKVRSLLWRRMARRELEGLLGREDGPGAEESGKGGADSAMGETGAVGRVVGNEERARLSREAEEDMVSVFVGLRELQAC